MKDLREEFKRLKRKNTNIAATSDYISNANKSISAIKEHNYNLLKES